MKNKQGLIFVLITLVIVLLGLSIAFIILYTQKRNQSKQVQTKSTIRENASAAKVNLTGKSEVLFFDKKNAKLSVANGNKNETQENGYYILSMSDSTNKPFQDLLKEWAKIQGVRDNNKTLRDVRKMIHSNAISKQRTHADPLLQATDSILKIGSKHLLGDCTQSNCWSCFFGCSTGDCCVCNEPCSIDNNCDSCEQCYCPQDCNDDNESALCGPCQSVYNGLTSIACSSGDYVGEQICEAAGPFAFLCDAGIDAACDVITNGGSTAAACSSVLSTAGFGCCETTS